MKIINVKFNEIAYRIDIINLRDRDFNMDPIFFCIRSISPKKKCSLKNSIFLHNNFIFCSTANWLSKKHADIFFGLRIKKSSKLNGQIELNFHHEINPDALTNTKLIHLLGFFFTILIYFYI